METTEGHLLGGRLRYAQPRRGFRSGIEPILLAASIPARPGERVLEGGSGAGAILLCLAARVPGVRGLGVERDPALADLARNNAIANGYDGLDFLTADIIALPEVGCFDHAGANPPYHPAGGTAASDPSVEAAKRAGAGLVASWAAALAGRLRPGGTLTLILPVSGLAEALAALGACGCGAASLLPLWPKAGREAKLMILRGIRGRRGTTRLLPGLVLHRPDGSFTDEAEACLRAGASLAF
ncbi:MAG: methyltransferase [Pseudomonadota bacterium]|nr:methyltransferase [Pseudomonadota bacterium]